mmetsp:Transcript_128446/g.363517  ORF Transcript_128446/g.363517 Transcript_128446/m.363517 type:complete len:259 (-) Transcript_128446:586-1362(-)
MDLAALQRERQRLGHAGQPVHPPGAPDHLAVPGGEPAGAGGVGGCPGRLHPRALGLPGDPVGLPRRRDHVRLRVLLVYPLRRAGVHVGADGAAERRADRVDREFLLPGRTYGHFLRLFSEHNAEDVLVRVLARLQPREHRHDPRVQHRGGPDVGGRRAHRGDLQVGVAVLPAAQARRGPPRRVLLLLAGLPQLRLRLLVQAGADPVPRAPLRAGLGGGLRGSGKFLLHLPGQRGSRRGRRHHAGDDDAPGHEMDRRSW